MQEEYIVPIIMGSKSDQEWAEQIIKELKKWEIPYKTHIASAHKVPELLLKIIKLYDESNKKICYITIAGRSNGLSGVTASNSINPVIACPPFKDKIDMLTNINSTLQMPSDTPVLTIIDKKNIAPAIARIFGLNNEKYKQKVKNKIKEIKNSFNI